MARQSPSAAGLPDVDGAARRSRWPARIEVGRIVKPHGVRGEVALEIWGEVGDSLRAGAVLVLRDRATELRSLRGAGERVLARLDGIDSRDEAEDVRGEVLSVASDTLPIPGDGEVYLFELEGCRVEVEQDGRVADIGTVCRVIEDGGGLLLEIVGNADPSNRSELGDASVPDSVYLIPYVSAYLRGSDLGRGVLRFALPEGLLETCVSTS